MSNVDQVNKPPEVTAGARRPIKARQSRWAAVTSAWLARKGVSPNAISAGSVVCGAIAGGAFVGTTFVCSTWQLATLYVLAIVGIQGRLVCNLLDGMVAVEGGKGSESGEIYNDVPDRLADPIILIAAGYAASAPWGVPAGWLAAILAVMTAYVRVLGRSIGSGIYFTGPMAKQHRMAVLTAACVACACTSHWDWHRHILLAALAIIVLGCVVTVVRRLKLIVRDLEGKP